MKKLFALIVLWGAAAQAVDVVDLKVTALDGFGGDTSSVLSLCQTKVGSVYTEETLSSDVKALTASGQFQEVTVDAHRGAEGVEVTFFVTRKMRYYAPMVVKGNSFFNASRILKESELKDGHLYSEGDFAAAAAKVCLAYQKKSFPDAKVTPIAELRADGDGCTVTFLVDEGARQKVRAYVFEGVEHGDLAELRAAIGDYPWWNPVGWLGDAPITRDQLAQTVAKAREYYQNLGFLDVKISDPVRTAVEDGLCDIVYTVEEGPCYTIGSYAVEGLKRYPADAVLAKSALPAIGAVAGAKVLEEAAHRISVTVGSGDLGLADTRVEVRRIPRAEDPASLDIVFKVTEGVPVVISDVRIEGNDYTKDKVIRREISLGPGDRMLADRAEKSQRRLENLDYFARVRYYLKDTGRGKDAQGAEYRDLVYEVEEKNTGAFMVGVGASSVDSIYFSGELQQSNFDLFAPHRMFRGGGQKGRLYAQIGPRIQTYEVSVNEPHLFDRLLDLTVEAYRRQRWYDDYDVIRTGGDVALTYPVKFWPTWDPFGRFGVRLSGEFIELDDVEGGSWLYKGREVSLREEERKYGDAFEPVVRFFWSHDSRDSFRMPTRGSRTQIFADLAAAGDNKYYRLGFSHRWYCNVWERYNHVFMANFRAETIDGLSDEVPIYNRMFLGGPKSIRGIEYRGVSPYARRLGSDGEPTRRYDPWGGQTLVCANFEYTVPIVKMLRVAAFSDIGAVSADEYDVSDDFAWTVGLGLRIDIPMFPIRLDFATPIEKPSHADEEVFSFSVGYDF
ncbi:MAG: outer membrane protein assembly factor BamA [Kiritimatiellia bacterium]